MQAASDKTMLSKFWSRVRLEGVAPSVRRPIIGVIGGTVLLIGVALIVLPGPAFIVIPVGLAILASEFAWARRYLETARRLIKKAKEKKKRKKS